MIGPSQNEKLVFGPTLRAIVVSATAKRPWWPAFIASLTFMLFGLLLTGHPGIEQDEAIFGPPVYQPSAALYHIDIGGRVLPVMLMTYLGATKTWLYTAIFKLWKPSQFSIRVPLLLLYASSIWIFYYVLRMAHSWGAGATGAMLLATDPTYLLTGTLGWCNLQNVLMIAVVGSFLKFHENRNRLWLAAAMFCAGLCVWDKAEALWMLGGIIVALACIFPRQLLSYVRPGNLAVGLLAFSAGALPLIIFNIENNFVTLRSNVHFSFADFSHKLDILQFTANGSIWLGSVTNESTAPIPRTAENRAERWTIDLYSWTGDHRHEYMPYAFMAGVLLVPVLFFRRRFAAGRLLLFCLLALTVAWLQMAMTQGGGLGGHHPALLWPFPDLFIAVAISEATLWWRGAGRWLRVGLVVALIATNVLTVNQYLYQFTRFGSTANWSDAIVALSCKVSSFENAQIITADWGIANPLFTLGSGSLSLREEAYSLLSKNPSKVQKDDVYGAFAQRNAIWLAHTPGNETFAGVNTRLEKMAAEAGYRKMRIGTVADHNGRPIYEIFRLMSQK